MIPTNHEDINTEVENWELDLEDQEIALLINQLEALKSLLNRQLVKDDRLNTALELLEEMETDEEWGDFYELWTNLVPDLTHAMNTLPSTNFFNIAGLFYQAQTTIDDMVAEDGFEEAIEKQLSDRDFVSPQAAKHALETTIVPFFQRAIKELMTLDLSNPSLEDFKKVVNASDDLIDFKEIEESQKILVGLFDLIPIKLKQSDRKELARVFHLLMANQSRLNLIHLASESLSEA